MRTCGTDLPRTSPNQAPLLIGIGLPRRARVGAIGFHLVLFSPSYTDVRLQPKAARPLQPQASRGRHEINCRYCHAMVEVSPAAGVPPTQVCMNCHTLRRRTVPLCYSRSATARPEVRAITARLARAASLRCTRVWRAACVTASIDRQWRRCRQEQSAQHECCSASTCRAVADRL